MKKGEKLLLQFELRIGSKHHNSESASQTERKLQAKYHSKYHADRTELKSKVNQTEEITVCLHRRITELSLQWNGN